MIFDEAQTLPVPYLAPCVEAIAQLVQQYGAYRGVVHRNPASAGTAVSKRRPQILPIREILPGYPGGLYQAFRRTTMKTLGRFPGRTLIGGSGKAAPNSFVWSTAGKPLRSSYSSLPQAGKLLLLRPCCARRTEKPSWGESRRRLREGLPCPGLLLHLADSKRGGDVDSPLPTGRRRC